MKKSLAPNWNQAFNNDKVKDLEISIEDKNAVLRYSAIKIENIKIEESPEWLKSRLVAVNQKPINNIVDLTNYVMLECGQPMHAFDARQIKKIRVRFAEKNESLIT
jgi:phenylalanyl-tRNA synthetase beta chain